MQELQETGSIPGLGRSSGGGDSNLSSILAWKIPWTEEPSGLHPMGSQESDKSEQPNNNKEHTGATSFSAAFPTLLLLASFIVLWGSISAMAGNARAQLGHKEVGWREVRTGRVRGDPLWPRKGR